MSEDAHIVIVDDEAEVRDTIGDYLQKRGYQVSRAASGAELRGIVETGAVDLVLLDLKMPGEDGLQLAKYLRESTDAGVIMVTALADTADRIVGLEMGADDYIGKPCDLRELLARMKSVLRRRAGAAKGPDVEGAGQRLRFGRWLLDGAARRLISVTGTPVPLTSMEYDLLHALVIRPNRVLTRDQLLDLAHGKEIEPFDRSIDVRITRLRRKIELDPANPLLIQTVRGVGYMFVPEGETIGGPALDAPLDEA